MTLKLITPTTDLAIPVANLREHTEEADHERDSYLTGLIRAAQLWIGHETDTQIMPATWRLLLDEFPRSGDSTIEIELSPVQSIDTFGYFDVDGDAQELDAADYQFDAESRPARLQPAINSFWPVTQVGKLNAITIDFTAGHANAAAVPETAKQAIRLLAGYWYDYPAEVGQVGGALERSVMSLLDDLRWTKG